ncbi:PREDICTED: probable bifunctional methylthioribulose-1-phosphate dehydratase/enolase-phosphatase E1 2 isoform X4 [Theobroma cacao]|uniref:Probable bifunctional methylthioribulose-1-phosphate dehydratase/enolase-phosphatase E1 n=1 Tax=Theobroma cacao TaxID=3641 RepID=A0AB32VXQ1_THECC|nr:PREDICTED: probable bifunctional methylthioribulose-1-phosphate dehydratase/enolase-phosphatase E1 2 isoform X4 [Theobroma cacao]
MRKSTSPCDLRNLPWQYPHFPWKNPLSPFFLCFFVLLSSHSYIHQISLHFTASTKTTPSPTVSPSRLFSFQRVFINHAPDYSATVFFLSHENHFNVLTLNVVSSELVDMEVQDQNEHNQEKKMLPPTRGTFQSREELLKHVRDFALTQGYMVSIRDSAKDRYVTVACDRGGVYRKRLKNGENMRQRKNASRLTNCPFEVVGKKDDDVWTLTVKNGEHNHEPSNTSDHPSCRRFTEEEVLIIRDMSAAGKRPRQILKALRQRNPNLVSDSRNVYNVKAKIRRGSLSGEDIQEGKKAEVSCSSSTETMNTNGVAATVTQAQPMVHNSFAMSQAYVESKEVTETKALVAELCQHFYTLGWLAGTGGSITIRVHDGSIPRHHQLIVMSPSGVQMERMVAEGMYVLSSDGFIMSTPPLKLYPYQPPKCTDCAPLFMKVYEICNAGAVVHSHGLEACLVTMINPFSKEFRITHMEMIKGIQGHGYHDELVVPIIENTAHEGELTESLTEAMRAYPKTTAVLVRNHGVYIWGDSWISTKTQAECYHYLFDAAIKLHQLGLDWSSPNHGPLRNVNGLWGCAGNSSRGPKVGTFGLDYMIEPSQRCLLLTVEGTVTPMSFVTDILFPYAHDNVRKHLAMTYDTEETQHDIDLLRSQIQEDLEQGVAGAVPIPPDYVGKELVIASLAANVEAMINTDRKVTSLKQLEGRIWRTGFQSNELVAVVFEDVPEALEKWHASGIKVYIFACGSREVQQLLFANSNYGDLRKYLCGFFDTTVGNKQVAHSYFEILQTVGVDRPADMLFVTDRFQEAEAARAAGLEVIISIRPGNGPLPQNHGFRTIASLLEI